MKLKKALLIAALGWLPFSPLANADKVNIIWPERARIIVEQKNEFTIGIEAVLDEYHIKQEAYAMLNVFNEGNSSIKAGPVIGTYNSFFLNMYGTGGIAELNTSLENISFSSRITATKWNQNILSSTLDFNITKKPWNLDVTWDIDKAPWGADTRFDTRLSYTLDGIIAELQFSKGEKTVISLNIGYNFDEQEVTIGAQRCYKIINYSSK